MKVAWVSYIDPYIYSGGGELQHRSLIAAGRARGHEIVVKGFLRSRPQRAVRRLTGWAGFGVPTDADAYVLANVRNVPTFPTRIPDAVLDRILATGRAAVLEDAWVDLCPFDLPCLGDPARCRPDCDRSFARDLFTRARVAIFNSPMQRDAYAAVLGAALPEREILVRPPIDTTMFRDLGLERDIDVLYVGTISEYKGYHELIERFGADRLTFAGPNHLGHDVAGTYLGPVAYEDVPALMNRARIFAHLPRWMEPMGRTPVEASLCGCEVVLNDRVGVASYPPEVWNDPDQVGKAAERFWNEFEEAFR